MVRKAQAPAPERVAILQWAARIGAVSAEALAHLQGTSVPSARARLNAAVRERLLACERLLVDRPALYTVTRAGMRASGLAGLDPCRVSVATAQHTLACVHTAAALERSYPEVTVMGERELRREERESGKPLASAALGRASAAGVLLHRPDLVLWPSAPSGGAGPIAVEVELTSKAPRRLTEICRAWARARHLGGVLYLAPPTVERALVRAIASAQATERIVVVPLDSLPLAAEAVASIARTVPSAP
jgi:hypothetical protein